MKTVTWVLTKYSGLCYASYLIVMQIKKKKWGKKKKSWTQKCKTSDRYLLLLMVQIFFPLIIYFILKLFLNNEWQGMHQVYNKLFPLSFSSVSRGSDGQKGITWKHTTTALITDTYCFVWDLVPWRPSLPILSPLWSPGDLYKGHSRPPPPH